MGIRRKARELAVQVLFYLEFIPMEPGDAFDMICKNFQASRSSRGFSKTLVCGVFDNIAQIDNMLRRASRNWRLERMSKLDRSILRLAVFEILFLEDIPPKVSIDEAVEIGKRYGTEESGAFINGILDNIYNSLDD